MKAARIPMMEITTRSSINVKPRFLMARTGSINLSVYPNAIVVKG